MYDIQIVLECTPSGEPFEPDPADLRRVVEHVLAAQCCLRAGVSVAVVDDEAIRSLKKEFFDLDQVTDVISFDLGDATGGVLDCEVVVNARQAVRQAARRGGAPAAELALYVVHGLLHQLGYDDRQEDAAAAMHRREDELLRELGYGAVYAGGGDQ